MSFLINDFNFSNDVKNGLLKGSNYLSIETTGIGNKVSKPCLFKQNNSEWIKVSDWKRLCQNRIAGPVPNRITINEENTMFLMGGYLHGVKEDTSVPEINCNNYDNLLSDVLSSAIGYAITGDMGSSRMFLQTWLFMMTRFDKKHRLKTSIASNTVTITPYNL
jgi:hypothetical protein